MSSSAADPGDLVEDLTFRCLERLEMAGPRAVEELLADHAPDLQERVRRMLATLSRVGLADDEAPAQAPEQLGPYRLLERIGAGAMGVVYRAQGPGDTADLALKLLQPGLLPLRGTRVRFRREIAALRELDHPGICPILDDGEVDGVPYLAMPFVAGESLRERYARGQACLDPHERDKLLQVMHEVALALHHAHEHGFVHRDVKPGNVLVQADGKAVLLDFGLARLDRPEAGSTLTAPGGLVGTPAYMAPEQVAGRPDIDRRCDVYALGAMLYEGLTGRVPYEAPTRESLYRRILAGEVERPSRVARGVPEDLDVVCLTALERDPTRRYRTALDFAEDVQRLRNGEIPSARLPGPLQRVRRWVLRNPLPAALVAVLLVTLAGLLVATVRLRASEVTARARALAAAALEVLPADPDVSLHLALKAHDLDPAVSEVWPPMQAAVASERAEWRLSGHEGTVRSLEFSADGSMLLSGSADGTARLWRLGSHLPDPVLPHAGTVSAVAFRPDGEVAVTAGAQDGRICAWDTRTGDKIWEQAAHTVGQPVRVLLWSPDGRFLLTAGGDVDARVWTADGQPFCALPGTEGHVHAGVWLDASTVATGSGPDESSSEPPASYSLRVWRIREGAAGATLLREIPHEAGIVAIHPNPIRTDRALVVTLQTVAWLVDLSQGKTIEELDAGFIREVSGGGWSPDGARAFTTASGGGIEIWNVDGERCEHRMGPDHIAMSIANPGFPVFALCGDFGTAELRTYHGRVVREIGRKRMRGEPLAFSPDGRWLATVTWSGAIRVWSIWDREQPSFLHGGRALSAVWARGGQEVVTGGGKRLGAAFEKKGLLRVWDAESGRLLAEAHHDVQVLGMFPGVDGDRLIVSHGRASQTILRVLRRHGQEWRQDGETLTKPEIGGFVYEACFASDDRAFVCDHSGRVLVWDLVSRNIVQRLPADALPAGPASSYRRWMTIAATPGGEVVWTGSTLGYLHRFERGADGFYTEVPPVLLPETLRALKLLDDGSLLVGGGNGFLQRRFPDGRSIPFMGHVGLVNDVDWAVLDEEVVVASADSGGSIRFWRPDGTPLREIHAHAGGIWTVSFSPDGTRLLSASVDGTARIWLTRNKDLLDLARRRLRPLTDEQRERFRQYLER